MDSVMKMKYMYTFRVTHKAEILPMGRKSSESRPSEQ